MIPIMQWILVLTFYTEGIAMLEMPGKTACEEGLKTAIKAERIGADGTVRTGGVRGFCMPKGEPDYQKMGK